MQANAFVLAALLLYVLIGAGLVVTLRGITGIMAAIVIGWLFLPPARGINLPGIPTFTKEYSVSYAILLGVLIAHSGKLMGFRPKLIDLPILIFMLAPMPSSLTNGLGAYDGLSGVYANFFLFGIPYLMGRIFIKNPNDVKTVAKWFLFAGLIAVPMAVWESKMSPQLNKQLYGYHASDFKMAQRLGGYRPMMFMRHGLEAGLWIATSGAVAIWLWITSAKKFRLFNLPIAPFSAIILAATLLSRSLGAIILLAGTTAVAVFVRSTGFRIALIALILAPSIYLTVRISNIWTPRQFTAIIASIDADRADSLQARLDQEVNFSKHALRKPIFGWGGYNRFRPVNDDGSKDAVDGLTTIILGENGFVGLISYMCITTLPSLLMIRRIKGRAITSALWAPGVGIMLGIAIFTIDMMFNSFYTPLHLIGIGVIASIAVQAKQWQQIIQNHQNHNHPPTPPGKPTPESSQPDTIIPIMRPPRSA
jgi:hypothetical protein